MKKKVDERVNVPTRAGLVKAAVPIFKYEKRPEQDGDFPSYMIPFASGALIEVERYLILLTAAHVSEWVNLCVPCGDAFNAKNPKQQTLYGTRRSSKKENAVKFGKNDWSIIFLSTPAESTETADFCKRVFAVHHVSEDKKNNGPYSFCGYPNVLNQVTRATTKFSLTSYIISNMKELSDDDYEKYGIDKNVNIAFYFFRCLFINKDTKKQTPHIRLKGISGGPILDKDGNLVAVFTECLAPGKILVGVRITKIIDDLLSFNYTERNISQEDEESGPVE